MNKRQHKKLMRKIDHYCEICGRPIIKSDKYGMRYDVCSVSCGDKTIFGMSYLYFY